MTQPVSLSQITGATTAPASPSYSSGLSSIAGTGAPTTATSGGGLSSIAGTNPLGTALGANASSMYSGNPWGNPSTTTPVNGSATGNPQALSGTLFQSGNANQYNPNATYQGTNPTYSALNNQNAIDPSQQMAYYQNLGANNAVALNAQGASEESNYQNLANGLYGTAQGLGNAANAQITNAATTGYNNQMQSAAQLSGAGTAAQNALTAQGASAQNALAAQGTAAQQLGAQQAASIAGQGAAGQNALMGLSGQYGALGNQLAGNISAAGNTAANAQYNAAGTAGQQASQAYGTGQQALQNFANVANTQGLTQTAQTDSGQAVAQAMKAQLSAAASANGGAYAQAAAQQAGAQNAAGIEAQGVGTAVQASEAQKTNAENQLLSGANQQYSTAGGLQQSNLAGASSSALGGQTGAANAQSAMQGLGASTATNAQQLGQSSQVNAAAANTALQNTAANYNTQAQQLGLSGLQSGVTANQAYQNAALNATQGAASTLSSGLNNAATQQLNAQTLGANNALTASQTGTQTALAYNQTALQTQQAYEQAAATAQQNAESNALQQYAISSGYQGQMAALQASQNNALIGGATSAAGSLGVAAALLSDPALKTGISPQGDASPGGSSGLPAPETAAQSAPSASFGNQPGASSSWAAENAATAPSSGLSASQAESLMKMAMGLGQPFQQASAQDMQLAQAGASRLAALGQGSGITSDRRAKVAVQPAPTADAFLDTLAKSKATFAYKNPADQPVSPMHPKAPGARFGGVMAQDMERVPEIGSGLVTDTPRGKMLEPKAVQSAELMALGRVAERLGAIEQALGMKPGAGKAKKRGGLASVAR